MMSFLPTDGVPMLNALRPEEGEEVLWAVFATYSADLSAAVASLLALAGRDDERGKGSKVDLAEALTELRGKVRFVFQAGRLGLPRRARGVMVVLDQFFREVCQSELQGSWHPKVALVRMRAGEATRWRLWVSSRNLTQDTSWDAGLLLLGGSSGAPLPGVAELGSRLLERAELPDLDLGRERKALEQARWQSPDDTRVEEIRLLLDGDTRGLPSPPTGLRFLLVVSPYLDTETVKTLGSWGQRGTARALLSTRPALEGVVRQAPESLEGFTELLALEPPQIDTSGPEESDTDTDAADLARGLHAKLILATHEKGHTLWLGSANATRRGWRGPNAEVVARLTVPSQLAESLVEFARTGRTLRRADLEGGEPPDEQKRAFEKACARIASGWRARLILRDERPTLLAETPPHPDLAGAELSVGLLGGEGWHWWPPGASELMLPRVHKAELTGLIRVQLVWGDLSATWVATASLAVSEQDLEGRDRAALARHLGARAFLQWIRGLLLGNDDGDEGDDWDKERSRSATKGAWARGLPLWAPTLEDALRCWARNRDELRHAHEQVVRYIDALPEEMSEEERVALATFRATWSTVVHALLEDA